MSGESLEELRQQFLKAEEELRESVAAIKGIRSASQQLGDARQAFSESSLTLVKVQDQFGKVGNAMTASAGDLKRAIDLIGQTDPAQLRGALEATRTEMKAGLDALGRAQAELQEAIRLFREESASSTRALSALRSDVLAAIEGGRAAQAEANARGEAAAREMIGGVRGELVTAIEATNKSVVRVRDDIQGEREESRKQAAAAKRLENLMRVVIGLLVAACGGVGVLLMR